MRSLIFAVAWIGAGVAQAAGADEPPSWCNKGQVSSEGVYRPDATIKPVAAEHMAKAIDELQVRSVIALDRKAARRLLGGARPNPKGHYHLVRSSVYAPIWATTPQLSGISSLASYNLYVAGRDANLVAGQGDIPEGWRPRNLAMVVRTSAPISNLRLVCVAFR
jgi:hypothetical protein